VYAEEFSQVTDAIAWEKRLKQWTHKKKRAFAEQIGRYSNNSASAWTTK